jgi:hypothetical protein
MHTLNEDKIRTLNHQKNTGATKTTDLLMFFRKQFHFTTSKLINKSTKEKNIGLT